jgi:hypothetical protein
MFEKHRIQSVKELLGLLVRCELRYHCKVVQELSSVLQELGSIGADD